MEWGGSNIRPEATGWGSVYFGIEILKSKGESIKVRHLCLAAAAGSAWVGGHGCQACTRLQARPLQKQPVGYPCG
jgi:glutamate dehydrogenase (NADP+)